MDPGVIAAAIGAMASVVVAIGGARISARSKAHATAVEGEADVIVGAQDLALELIRELRATTDRQATELLKLRQQPLDLAHLRLTVDTVRNQFSEQIDKSDSLAEKLERLDEANQTAHQLIMDRLDHLEQIRDS